MRDYLHSKKILLFLIFFFSVFVFLSCASIPLKSYDEQVSQWTSYKDVQIWMENYFTYSISKLKEGMANFKPGQPLPIPINTPRQTYEERTGVCYDAALFAKETLNRIDPSYEAEIVFIERRPYFESNHVVCSLKIDGKLYIMDYGVPKKTMRRGVFGPFSSLEEYGDFHVNQNPKLNRIKSISFGWPEYAKVRVPDLSNL